MRRSAFALIPAILLVSCGPLPLPKVETPLISPAGGTFTESVQVTISCATDGAVIRYTLDGMPPADADPVYSGPLTVGASLTVCASAAKEGMEASETACAFFLIAPQAPATARHVILFIGDGMQMENEVAASRTLYGTDDGLSWHGFPHRCFVTTWDVSAYNVYAAAAGNAPFDEGTADPLVGFDPSRGGTASYPADTSGDPAYLMSAATDSASAATAMATGFKTDNGNISWLRGDPAGGELQTIAERLRADRGVAVGIVSTVPFNHATPAAFAAHSVTRGDYAGIAAQMLSAAGPEVVIGGGWNTGTLSADALALAHTDPGLRIVERAAGADGGDALMTAAASLPPGIRLFGLFGGADGAFGVPAVPEDPSLADAVLAALAVLSRDGEGLFLMAEQGDIDWANHGNDYARMIGAMSGLEAAVRAVLDYVDAPGDAMDWSNTLLIVTADHATGLLRLPPAGTAEATYGTKGHTNEPVTLSARGVGSDLVESLVGVRYPGTRLIDNTDVYRLMAAALTP